MTDILFVSIAFPPKNDPECIQAAKYFKYVVRHAGVNVDVVTSAHPTLFMPTDVKLEPYARGARQLIEIPFFESRYVNFAIRKLCVSILEKPDSKLLFARKVSRGIPALTHVPDCIYSRSFPISSTIAAYHLAMRYNVPWVLHLSDPWADSPLHHYSPRGAAFHGLWEARCFERADRICLTSRQTVEFYQNKYPHHAQKFLLFPNVFDPEDVATEHHSLGGKLRFVYTGGLVGDRTPDGLLEVLSRMYERDPSIADRVDFTFAGQFDRRSQRSLATHNLPFVRSLGHVSFSEAAKLQRNADVLLVIDTPFKRDVESMFFPSKLLDYIAAKRRILAITNANSPTVDVVDTHLGDWCLHGDVEMLERLTMAAILRFGQGDRAYFVSENVDPQFSAAHNAARLVALIEELT